MTAAAEDDRRSLVLDASAMVELLARTALARPVSLRIRQHELHAPALFDAEVLSALARLQRAGHLRTEHVDQALRNLASAPVVRHSISDLLLGTWGRRHDLRLTDALYVELAGTLRMPLITTDLRLARACSLAEPVAR